MGTVRYRQESPIYHIAYTADGKYVVTDGEDSILRVWDAADGRLIRRIDPGVGLMGAFALGSDPNTVTASGFRDNRNQGKPITFHVTSTNLATGRRVSETTWSNEGLHFDFPRFALCPHRQLLAMGPEVGSSPLRIIRTTSGAEVCRFNLVDQIERMTFAPDGKRLAVDLMEYRPMGTKYRVVVLDIDKAREIRRLESEHDMRTLAFSHDGKTLAVRDSTRFQLCSIATGELSSLKNVVKEVLIFSLYKPVPVDFAAFSSDGRRLAAISNIGQISVCDPDTRRLTDSFDFPGGTMGLWGGPVALSPDARTLAAVGGTQVVHLWDLDGHRDRLAMPASHCDMVNELLITPDGKTLLTASDDGTIRLWDLATGRQRKVLKHTDPAPESTRTSAVSRMGLSTDGRFLVSATKHPTGFFVWDLEKADEPVARSDEAGRFDARNLDRALTLVVRFDEHNRSVVELDQLGELREWDPKNRRMKALDRPSFSQGERPYQQGHYQQGTFLAGGRRLAVIDSYNGLQVSDLSARRELFGVGKAKIFAASPDERTLAIARSRTPSEMELVTQGLATGTVTYRFLQLDPDGTIVLLDGETGRETRQIPVVGSQVRAMAFSPDGKTLAATTGRATGQIHLFEVATGKEIQTIDTPSLASGVLAFTPDGKRLVTGMADASILIWDVRAEP